MIMFISFIGTLRQWELVGWLSLVMAHDGVSMSSLWQNPKFLYVLYIQFFFWKLRVLFH